MSSKLESLQLRYEEAKAKNLDLDMRRGKPGSEQLDLTLPMLDLVTSSDYKTAAGADTRNYGGIDGIPEMKTFFKEFLEVSSEDEVIVGGNSSLNLMHDTVARAMSHGVVGSELPWSKLGKVKFLCPSPGYDRHFSVCQHFGIEMITVDMTPEGPDCDQIEKLVAEDDSIKGIWVVPKYSNPTGITCSEEVVSRLAKMTTAATDFRIFWDNAYSVHHLADEGYQLANIFELCKAANTLDRVFIYGSSSKISFAGSGVAAMAGSKANMDWMKGHLSMSTIGPDKINQVRHMRFFKDFDGLKSHMKKHAEIIKPKFDTVIEVLEAELGGKGVATWTKPNGGYFISLDTNEGCAKRVVELADAVGVKLTGAGATFPYKNDPKDSNIRLAPTFPSIDEIRQAMEVVCLCVELADAEK
ncbi:aminotransferase class I/II-fold pyridoxal phosphate-dependent enzyme [Sediminitomix flava]|uniref:DNA-binding transcriptional MocR family regulator n=1 Tax=Sediminitomix flava TaxID=379075 RepID=A0A315Z5C3_SEDFL|nr:aminotransferase class I/II-fold pyridoxal phosphate-dependent enzyme [Sediminitomix flava]PWJ38467.1 DNA-binding transcriptional MocR family regulator [Sediminitomix flava]